MGIGAAGAVAVFFIVASGSAAAASSPVDSTLRDSTGGAGAGIPDLGRVAVSELSDVEVEAYAGRFLDEAYTQASSLPGFVDGGWAEENPQVLEIQWHGDESPALRRIVDEAATRDVDVEVIDTRFSRSALKRATNAIAAAFEARDLPYDGIGPTDGHGGIFVEIPDYFASAALLREAGEVAKVAADGVPVSISSVSVGWNPKTDEPPQMMFDTRYADTGDLDVGA